MAEGLRALGAETVVSPLLEIVIADALPPLAPALVLTSQNGVAAYHALGGPAGLPCWCVGPATAEAARAAGLKVRGWAPDAAVLARTVPADAPPILHLRGAVQRGDLAADLRRRGIDARSAPIYAQEPRPLSDAGLAAMARGAVVPLYSPRTAALLAQAVPLGHWAGCVPLALSPAVAAALPVPARTAPRPDAAALWPMVVSALKPSAVEGGDPSD
jgi:uroporphyrinogen-III synthase